LILLVGPQTDERRVSVRIDKHRFLYHVLALALLTLAHHTPSSHWVSKFADEKEVMSAN
jgi:hypothetical protein